MPIDDANYFLRLDYVHPKIVAQIFLEKKYPKGFKGWILKNEIKPVDMYCYLYAKYGPPNGFMNFLKSNSSDNLVHWEWTLINDDGLIQIQGQLYKTEIHLLGVFNRPAITKQSLIEQFRSDLKKYGKQMKDIRLQLEKWIEFVNPFQTIQSTIDIQIKKLRELNLQPSEDKVHTPTSRDEMATYAERFSVMAEKYTFGTGLAFGLRCMMPVLAETFLNLLIFVLAKKDIRDNESKYRAFVSDTITGRLNLLHTNCIGFDKPVDHAHEACRNFYQLMADRNDLLHGNFNINRLKIGDVYFNGKTPVKQKYEDLWGDTIGVTIASVKLERIESNYSAVQTFITYLMSLLSPKVSEGIDVLMSHRDLGYNEKLSRLGVLFSVRAMEGFLFFEDEFEDGEFTPSNSES
ncbi:hypothetical protein [Pseudomonas parafulva]|uniref:hypothetical protein n=1 Tax=Pseudomonas parafulva TaxID=157782 RepID=UPI0004042642|nr:hypothetical protein [Pseudomonas parafulva]